MSFLLLDERFQAHTFSPRLRWFNPPPLWSVDPLRSCLTLETEAATDFWQETHYGFRADSGHFLYMEIPGDAIITTGIQCHPAHQYDQAGLMARFSHDCWIKVSTEFEPQGASHLGAVVTNSGFSDWSFQNFPYPVEPSSSGTLSYCLRLRREGADFLAEHAPAKDGPWSLMRIARLLPVPGAACQVGLYACSPKGSGYRVESTFLRIESPSPGP